MVKRRVVYRKKKQNRMGMFLVFIVLVMLTIVVSAKSTALKSKNAIYVARINALNEQIEEETARTEEIEEFRKYTQTKKYMEEVAKEKLGLVNEGEIIYKPEN